jgi:g-D-glutamyl-meso-diaminopimelate peptidase
MITFLVDEETSIHYIANLFRINPNFIYVNENNQMYIPGFFKKQTPIDDLYFAKKALFDCLLNEEILNLVNEVKTEEELKKRSSFYNVVRTTPNSIVVPQPYSFLKMENDIARIQQLYPFLIVNEIGKSTLGKPIYELLLGNGSRKIHWNGSFHANEWITSCVLMKMVEWLCYFCTFTLPYQKFNGDELFSNITLSIVPMVNPDGVDLVVNGKVDDPVIQEQVIAINGGSTEFTAWKANIRGVDLNNQFPANWEIAKVRKKPKTFAPRDYPGEYPLSEVESILMANLVKERQFDLVVALHTQGKEFYWGYEGLEPEESVRYAEYFAKVSPFKSVQTIDSHAGFKDWFIQEYRKPGFTLELGKGINPLPLSKFEEIYSETVPILLGSLLLI